MKRYHIPKPKPNELSICYGIEDRGCNPDVLYCHGGDGATSSDARYFYRKCKRELNRRPITKSQGEIMTDYEWLRFDQFVKCNWLFCAGGEGLAGNGCCSFRGDYKAKDCPKFITNEDWDKKMEER